MNRSISIAEYVYRSMRPYRIGIPLLLSLMSGILAGILVIATQSSSDYTLIRTLSPHLSTLVETSDRTEMMRLLSSVAKEREVDLVVVQNSDVIASTRGFGEMDSAFVLPKTLIGFGHTEIDHANLINSTKVSRLGGAETNAIIYAFTPIYPLLWSAFLIALVLLILGMIISYVYARKVTKTMRQALLPIETMDLAISNLLDDSKDTRLDSSGITELDRIQTSIYETKRALSNTTDKLAEAKAKILVTMSYQHLIHDLYTPIAAFTEAVRGVNATHEDNLRASRLAEQVLNQIAVAKENLGNEIKMLQNDDIRQCIADATEEALLASGKRSEVFVTQNIPSEPVLVPHDSSGMRRAISNLVSNAIKACKGSIVIDLEKKDSKVVIRVSDDGEGVKREELTLIMQGRLKSKNNDRLALGLPSANHIAKLHGGRIVYSSSKLGGACFEIRI